MSLFVPLATPPYRAFENGIKTVEVRQDAPRWKPEAVYAGRRVRLRRGYSTPDQLMAVVGRVYRGLWENAPHWVLDGCPLNGIGGEGQPRYFDTARPIVAFECLDITRCNLEVGRP